MLLVSQIHVMHMPDFRAVKCFMVVHPCEINIRRGLIAECCKLFELELPLILIDCPFNLFLQTISDGLCRAAETNLR